MQSDVAIPGPFKILLVDDDPATRILVTRILRQPDYAFTEADHAIQALDLLEKSSFDLVITDLRMPEDRKSTRLNSSHRCISYAVFCLKKKKKINIKETKEMNTNPDIL